MKESYLATGRFTKLGRGFKRHCGPTAACNLLLTLLGDRAPAPEALFLACADYGRHHLCYVNADILGRWGGTSDLLSWAYLRGLLDRFGLRSIPIAWRQPLRADQVGEALDRGSVLYLQLRHHPKYGDHHLLCYGRRADGALRLADGWAEQPVYTSLRELGRGHFLEIHTNP